MPDTKTSLPTMEYIFEGVIWIAAHMLLFLSIPGMAAENGTSYSLDVVFTDMVDNNLTPKNLSRADCIQSCYWSMFCASMIYEETGRNCYLSNDLYTIFDPPKKLSNKIGSTVYQWSSDDCPRSTWSFHKPTGYCLKYHGSTLSNFATATSVCINEGGRLVNVMDAKQNDVIDYIGGNSGRNEIWLGGDVISNTWHLGEEITYMNWAPPAPTTGCVVLVTASGQWGASACTLPRMFICEKITFNPCTN